MKETMGVDWGKGVTNIDTKTGIRYGVINQREVLEAWCDSSEPDFLECREDEESGCLEPLSYSINDGKYKAQSGEDGDIFIVKSPYYTRCLYCSPCAPGAGWLMSPDKRGIKAYCFGHDWFASGVAPYPVFSVKTNRSVSPEKFQKCTVQVSSPVQKQKKGERENGKKSISRSC
jgi:hypothetical protein